MQLWKNILCAFVVCGLFSPALPAQEVRGPLIVVTSLPESLFKHYRAGFTELYPEVELHILNKKTPAAILAIESESAQNADIFWASAPDAFEVLKREGLLVPTFVSPMNAETLPNGQPLVDPDGSYRGFAVSGYGLMINPGYLEKHDLPEPSSWRDLTSPVYRGHIGISSPSRSGTTHLIIEMILQHYGWDDGWAILLEMSGNLATITARSYSVPEGVSEMQYGIGLVIDFFALSARATGQEVEYISVPEGVYLPANIALLKRGGNPVAAQKFIDFVFSEAGQRLLLIPEISRLPVRRQLYDELPDEFPTPWGKSVANGRSFDTGLSRQRYHLVNALFDRLITFRLEELKRSWQILHRIEKQMQSLDNESRENLGQARHLLSMPPVTSTQAIDIKFTGIFKPSKPSVPTPALQLQWENEWNRVYKQQMQQARQLLEPAADLQN